MFSKLTKAILVLSILAIILFAFSGHLDPVIVFLDSEQLSFELGSVKLSVYSILKSVFAIIVIFSLARIFSNFVEGRIRKLRRMNFSNRQLLIKTSQVVTYIITFLITLRVIGVDLKALTILSGGIGIGIGFGMQKISSNFISGIILLFEKTIEKDDLIEIDGGLRGFIKKIRARYTLIETLDNREIMIPNEDLITQKVTNCTYSNSTGRVDVEVGVSYGSDMHKVRDLILEAALENPLCLKDPEPKCSMTEFGNSSVNFVLYFWLQDVSSGVIFAKSEVMFSIWDKFKQHGIEIPFPQRDLNFRNPLSVKLEK